MKTKKVYGIHGLLEWHGVVVTPGAKMKVDFTNGSVTANGVSPATFTTSDPLTQHIMEHSDQFKGGRIKLIQVIQLPGDEDDVEPKSDDVDEPSDPGTVDDVTVEKVTVGGKMEAIEYLKEHFPEKNYTSVGLRSKAAFQAACKECGVEFVFS